MGDKVELKLISEFDGSTPVLEWVEKVKLICHLCWVKCVKHVIPLWLTGSAFTVYEQFSDKETEDQARIKVVLYKVFAIDPCITDEQFVAWTLWPGENMDNYLSAMKQLVILFGSLPEQARLPSKVKQLL